MKVKVSFEIETTKGVNKQHPAIGIWANRFTRGSSTEIADELRYQIENRVDGIK